MTSVAWKKLPVNCRIMSVLQQQLRGHICFSSCANIHVEILLWHVHDTSPNNHVSFTRKTVTLLVGALLAPNWQTEVCELDVTLIYLLSDVTS